MSRRPHAMPPEEGPAGRAILAGERSISEAARRAKVSDQALSNWKRRFIEAGYQGVAEDGTPGANAARG